MATFRKRGASQWEAQIRRRGYPTQSRTFTTKTDAETWARIIESEMSRGVWVSRTEAESTTLLEAVGRYEIEIIPSKKGLVQEKSVVRILKALPLAKRPIASIRSADIATLRDDWLKDYQAATVVRRLAVLSHIFSIARKEWGMESLANPVSVIRKPQLSNSRTRRVLLEPKKATKRAKPAAKLEDLPDEVSRIIGVSGSDALPPITVLAIETAMRRGEIANLTWDYIDLKRRVAHLPKTKNGSARDVPLSRRAIAALAPLHKAYSKKNAEEDNRVFKIRGDAITRAFERAVERARRNYIDECESAGKTPQAKYLTDLRFHDLRHEAISRLASVFPLHELTKITGHKDPRMLMRYYHPRAEDLVKRLDAASRRGLDSVSGKA